MLSQGHIFTIKTKDPENVSHIQAGDNDVVISGLNVLKDQIEVGDFVFVVFGGDKPKGWTPGLVALAHISKAPFDEGYAGDRNFRVKIDVDLYLSQSIVRKDLVTYPATFDTIGIGPITRWEPNQAITAVDRKNAIALLQAICDICPIHIERIKEIVGEEFEEIGKPILRYALAYSPLGRPAEIVVVNGHSDSDALGGEFEEWMMRVAGKSQKTAKDTARVYVPSISDELQEPTKSIWHGLREVLYGDPAPKSVYAIENVSELNEYYAGIGKLFAKSYDSTGYDDDRFKKCWDWVHSSENHNSIRAGWALFTRFMQWREARQSTEELPKNVDVLSVALKMFDEERKASDKHNKSADFARAWFADYTPQKLKDDFATFQRDLIWSKNVRAQVTKDYAYVDKLAYLLDELKKDPRPLAYYLGEKFKAKMDKCPGIGLGTIVDMLMKMHPDEYCAYTDMMHGSLKMLGLLPADASKQLNSENYRRAMGLYEEIRQRMIQMGIHLTRGENTDDPDFLTVNSFLWFVKENIDLIKEKVMSKKMKTEAPTKYDEKKRKELKFDPASKDDKLLLRLLSALRAKPFAILAGHSGTGKSRYVKKLAYMTCNMDELRNNDQLPGNCLLLQVKPNWHDSTELLGFRNAMDENKYQKTKLIEFLFRAYHFKDTPFFLCLDEMNLAPVEQYFAEFLSSMESKEPIPLNDISENEDNLVELGCEWTDARDYLAAKGFSIPDNLFIVGTVNMDETTNQFSRKVLDRAFTIEMTDVDFKSYGKVTEPSYDDTLKEETIQALLNGPKKIKELDADDIVEEAPLVKVQKALEPTAFAVAYRFANEYTLLKRAIACFDPEKKMGLDALDQAVLMKVLPRIAGERDYIEIVYGKKEDEGLRKALAGKVDSLKKIEEILKRAKDMNAQYVTFWP